MLWLNVTSWKNILSTISNNAGFSYLNQLQQLYSQPYKGTNDLDSVFSDNLTVNTSNDTATVPGATSSVDNSALTTQDSTTLSPDALKILQNLSASSQGNNIISELLGGGNSGSGDTISQLLGSSLGADPLGVTVLAQNENAIKSQSSDILKQELANNASKADPLQNVLQQYEQYNNPVAATSDSSGSSTGSDPIQKVLKAYQAIYNNDNSTGTNLDQVA
jgi:hypothetical protein